MALLSLIPAPVAYQATSCPHVLDMPVFCFFFLASLAERKDERVGISGKAAGQALESGAGRWREREGEREREREKFIDNQ